MASSPSQRALHKACTLAHPKAWRAATQAAVVNMFAEMCR